MAKLARSLHLRGRMSSLHPWIAPALGAWLLSTSLASAQDAGTNSTGAILVTPISIGAEDVNDLGEIKLGLDNCERNDIVVFELDDVPADKSTIAIYTGTDCNETDRNDEDVNRCEFVAMPPTDEQIRDLRIEIRARDLVGDCSSGLDSMPTIWFLAVDDPNAAEDVGKNYGAYAELNIDLNAPDAPGKVVGGAGENQIPIEWDADESDIDHFIVYIDSEPTEGGGAGEGGDDEDGGGSANTGDCGSSVLLPDTDADDLPESIRRKTVDEPTATGVELRPGDIDGTIAAVAVVAVDDAGNQSPLSNTGCVKVVPTESFWDRYEANGGEAHAGCPCSALGPTHAQSAWPVALSLLVLARGARRRRPS
jgi:hypothetical protein